MTIEYMFGILSRMNEMGLQSYFWGNTVVDIMNDSDTRYVSIVTTVGPKKIEQFVAKEGYEGKYDENTRTYKVKTKQGMVFVRTLKYETFNSFTENVLPVDFSCNTLIMNEDRQVMDVHKGLVDVKEKNLRVVAQKDILTQPFMYGKYQGVCKEVLVYGFKPIDQETAKIVCDYIGKFAKEINENQRKEICGYLINYINNEKSSMSFLRRFLTISHFYDKQCELNGKEIALNETNFVNQLDRNTLLIALAFLFQVTPEFLKDNETLEVVNAYAVNLFTEEEYDGLSDEYSYEILDIVIKIHNILKSLKKEKPDVVPFHHKPLFEEAKDNGFLWQSEMSDARFEFADAGVSADKNVNKIKESEKNDVFGQDFPTSDEIVEEVDTAEYENEPKPDTFPSRSADTIFAQNDVPQDNPYQNLQGFFSNLTHRNEGGDTNA